MHSLQFLGISIFQILHFLRGQPGVLIGPQLFPDPLALAAAAAVVVTMGDILAVIAGIGYSFHIGHLYLQNADYISTSSQLSGYTAGV